MNAKCNELQRAWTVAEKTPAPRPFGKTTPSVVAEAADVAVSRRAKSASHGSLKFKREHLK